MRSVSSPTPSSASTTPLSAACSVRKGGIGLRTALVASLGNTREILYWSILAAVWSVDQGCIGWVDRAICPKQAWKRKALRAACTSPR